MKENALLTIPFKEYKNINALTRGGIIDLFINGNTFWRKHIKKDYIDNVTPDMILGKLTHAMILEGDELSNYRIMPSSEKGEIWFEETGLRKTGFDLYKESKFFDTNDWDWKGKEKEKMFYVGNKDVEFVSLKTAIEAEELVEIFKKTEYYNIILKNPKCLKEQSFIVDIENTKLKGRMDAIGVFPDSKKIVIYDYKTTNAKNDKDILYSIRKYGYDIQAVLYIEAIKQIESYKKLLQAGYTIEFMLVFQSKLNPAFIFDIILKYNSGNTFIEDIMNEATKDFGKALKIYNSYFEKYSDTEWINARKHKDIMMSEFSFPYLLEETKRF